MSGPRSVWDDPAAVARLCELWATDLRAAAIGERLGISKSAVVGKAHRMGLPMRPSPIMRTGPRKLGSPRRAPDADRPRKAAKRQAPAPPSPRELRPGMTCLWPIGERPYRFCGEPVVVAGKSYCQEHWRLGHTATLHPLQLPAGALA